MSAAFTPGPWEAKSGHVIVPTKGIVSLVQNPWNDNAERHANAALIAAAPDLYAALEHAVAFLKSVPLESGVCCCGQPIETHGYDDGHSPVDELQYHAGGLGEKFVLSLRKRAANRFPRDDPPL